VEESKGALRRVQSFLERTGTMEMAVAVAVLAGVGRRAWESRDEIVRREPLAFEG
jgi:hypothetical protein